MAGVSPQTPQRQTGGTENFAGAREPLDQHVAEGERRFGMPITVLRGVSGNVECSEGAGSTYRPIVVRSAHGLGQVVWVACDLDQFPFLIGGLLDLFGQFELGPVCEWFLRR